jgi:dolichyl-phosphate-mannose-protein mannosyltransferase
VTDPHRFRRWVGPIGLGLLLLVGLVIRLVVLGAPGHYGDSVVQTRWAEHMATYGPWSFYQHDGAVYPALLYAYWPLGVLFDGASLARAVKGLSIPFDLALGVVVYYAARQMVGSIRALVAPAFYLLNPAVLLAGPVWGQIDAAGTLAYLAALLAVARGRFGLAGALTALAMLIKPQFGLAALPVGALAVIAWRAMGKVAPIVNALVGGVVVYLVVGIPLRLDPITFVGRAASIAVDKPMTSLNAPNVWGVLVGYSIPDAPYALIGGVLLLIGLLVSLLPLRRRQDLPTILAVGLFLVFAFYLLPTRVHERYLFPAMALLAPLAAANWRVLVAALLVTVGFTLTLLYALVTTTPFTIPAPLHDLLVTRTTVVWIGLALMATAAALVPLLLLQPRTEGTAASVPRG